VAEPYRRAIEQALEDTVLPGLEPAHRHLARDDAAGLPRPLLSFKGAAFGLEPAAAAKRLVPPAQPQRGRRRACYMVGASTHPGAGVPGVLMSAKALETVVPHVSSLPEQPARPEGAADASPDRPAACRALMRGGSKTFFAASLLLPRACAPGQCAVRLLPLADDEIDLGSDPRRALAEPAPRLDHVYAGRPQADRCRPRAGRRGAHASAAARAARCAAGRLCLGRRGPPLRDAGDSCTPTARAWPARWAR
jgi:hypothetical protein